MRKPMTLFILTAFILYPFSLFAELITLKDGTAINGEIIETAKEHVKVKTKYGNLKVSKADISEIKYPTEANTGQKPISNAISPDSKEQGKDRYEMKKLGLRTLDIYSGHTTGFSTVYFSGLFGSMLSTNDYETILSPKQAWTITKGGIDITDIEFMQVVEPDKAEKIFNTINKKILDGKAVLPTFWLLGVVGSGALIYGSVVKLDVEDPPRYNQSYGYTNAVVILLGAALALVGFILVGTRNNEISKLENLKTDPLIHFNSLDYTRDRILEYNDKLKVELKINF